jgi:ankyrin repeat protein/8-oxo-dGTP pyrophosphatase MutT (NUDIX family)
MLPPLTGLEFLHHRVENVDGDILIVAVRPSVNLRSMTIEKVIAKMQASHVQLLDLLTDGLRFAGVSPDALQPLTSLKARARQRDPLWFNATDNYRNATNGALDEQTRCFKLVLDDLKSDLKSAKARRPLEGKALVPESLEAERRRIKSTAFVAARAGQHEIAVELLLGRRRLEEGNKDETTPESLEAIAKELLDDGCKRPWPATLVALAGKRTHGLKDACLAQGCVEKLVRQALAGATVKPFSVGSEVLVCKELSFSASSSTWTNALIAKAAGPPASADESSRQKLSDDELTALVVEQHGSEPEDVAKFSGYVYNVEINGQVEQLPEEQVVQVDPHGGVAEVLKVAAATGDPDLVKELLDAGVNVFVTDTHLNTALIRVAEAVDIDTEHGSGQELCIKMLADRHPKQFFELRNKLRQNSFDIAVKNRSYVALRTMQPERHPGDTDIHKADVVSFRKRGNWAHDEKGWQNDVTTLMLTCRYHSHEPRVSAVKALLEAGANVDAVTAQKVTALHMAVDDMRVDIVEVLLASKANPNHEDEVARTPLLQAAQSGCVKVVDALIRFGADVLYQRKASRSILTYAAQYGYVDVAKRLLDAPDAAGRGDRPPLLNMRNKKGEESALTFAARYGHVPMCHLLLKRGIDLKHELEKPYWTSLHRACANGHTETASLLLRAEPGLLNHTKDTGITALMAAATAGYTETVILLLGQKGLGSLGTRDSKGKHALWLAAANGNEETVSVLAKHEPSCVDLIVEASAGAFRRDSDGGGPGQVAADDLTQTGGGQSSGRERIKGLDTTTTNIMQPTTALMAAAYFGHAGVVRVLHAEKANLAMFSEPPAEWTPGKQRPDDALLLATRNGHQPVVRILASLQQARRRLMEAQRLAESLKRKAITEGKTARVEQFKAILEVIMRPSMRRQRTNSVFRNHAGMKKQRSKGGMSEEEWLELGGRIRSNVKKLKWDRTAAFDGQIVPPRPHEDELKEEATPLGPLAKDDGVVVQAGPFGSIWLRAGCIRRVPWHTLWRTLKAYIEVVLQDETQKVKPGAVYVVVSLRSMQSIDFTWLAEQGFRFHHHRAPGHGATPHGVSSGNGDGSNGSGVAVADQGAVGGNAPTPTPPTPDVSDTEYVYYAWPGASMDMVPVYATSVEGATALVFSPDETKLLLVWERQAWSTPGGAVNAGESKLDALAREVQEEVGVVIDREWDGIRFLGGYQQEKARDGLVNDNFACFSVRATSDHFAVDGKEIHTAHWIPWKPVLKKWIANGRPKEKKVPFEDFGSLVGNPSIPSEKNVVLYNLLQWLETWVDDRGYRVKLKSSQQGSLPITKALFNSSF